MHIPRVGGSSLEQWLCGADWWNVQPATKHLLASQTKELYKEYWDDYFTFSFVRNPWDRVVSGLKFPGYFGIHFQESNLNFDKYIHTFGSETVLEYDHRYYRREDLVSENHIPGQIYGNILDEKLDFIGRFETLSEDCGLLREILGVETEMNIHLEKSQRHQDYRDYYNESAIECVRKLYAKDIERFQYEF